MGLRRLLLVVTMLAILVAPNVARAQSTDEPAAAPAAELVPGSGAASATVVKARLFYAGYSLQVSLGLAATTYENRQSRALGGAYDLSSALGLVSVKVPELSPVSIDSNAGDAEIHQEVGGPFLGAIDLRATTVPASTAEVRLADVDLTGLVRVEGGHAESSSTIVDGSRRATASVTVGSISLAGGLVSLDGLRWDVVHQTGAEELTEATFSLAGVSLAGIPISLDVKALDPVLDALNAALAPVGLVLTAPELVRRDNGAIDITPLRVGILNSPLGGDVLGPLVAGLRPLLVPVYAALTDVNSTLGLTSLVADLGLGVADGSGGVELTFGGATALTDDTEFADPLAGGPPPVAAGPVVGGGDGGGVAGSPTVGRPSSGVGAVGAPAVPSTDGVAPALVPASASGPERCVLAATPRRQGTCRGTNLPGAVAIVAIVAVGIYAHDVRLRRRRAEVAA